MTALILYMPVVHQGYINFLEKYRDIDRVYLLDRALVLSLFPHLKKDIRSLTAEQIKKIIEPWGFSRLDILDQVKISQLQSESLELILPDEEVSHELVKTFFADASVTFEPVFLRWDSTRSTKKNQVNPDDEVTSEAEIVQVMQDLVVQANRSADWWRQIGAVVVKNGKVLNKIYNRHVPDEQQPYFDGDPRADFHKGDHIDISTALHAEAGLIVQAAKAGQSLEGAELFVTTFPCPNCAKLVAYSGIKKLYYLEGYSMVDGERVMKANGVEIVRVKM